MHKVELSDEDIKLLMSGLELYTNDVIYKKLQKQNKTGKFKAFLKGAKADSIALFNRLESLLPVKQSSH